MNNLEDSLVKLLNSFQYDIETSILKKCNKLNLNFYWETES